ncbi:MAG TPA: UDP-2,3-diacylglucosamine diphosphatase [Cytophagaceae bacterium]|jgi:UDP-2,3-diacylglucosamine hydrolase|nr:UDP-2,3-diacylglucosamine diphosphatase [Cytophagaceae bacterium]
MILPTDKLPEGKKVFFASDFHLGVPDYESSKQREKKIIRWLDSIKTEAHIIFMVGDIFDFWFEYKEAIPKGYIRLQGKLAELSDAGIKIIFFTGNHDMWLFDYFTKELEIPVYRKPQIFTFNDQKFLVGHGDGLGPGDHIYKLIKKVFANRAAQWLFGFIHPNIGIGFANYCSRNSRIRQNKREDKFLGEDEWLLVYCRDLEKKEHHDYYIFGHRHLPLDIKVGDHSRYINLGEWVNYYTYAVFDGKDVQLKEFEKA